MYVLYVKTTCPFCDNAKQLLDSQREEYKVVDVTDSDQVWQQVKEAYSWKTVPMILQKQDNFFVLIGGSTDLEKYLVPNE